MALRVLDLVLAEYVRMATNHLVGDRPGHIGEGEGAGLLGHAGVVDDLEQQIAQLLLQLAHLAALDGVGDLVGFFDGVGGDAGEGLLDVPGAAALRVAQPGHDLDEPEQRVLVWGRGHSAAVGSRDLAARAARISPWRRASSRCPRISQPARPLAITGVPMNMICSQSRAVGLLPPPLWKPTSSSPTKVRPARAVPILVVAVSRA